MNVELHRTVKQTLLTLESASASLLSEGQRGPPTGLGMEQLLLEHVYTQYCTNQTTLSRPIGRKHVVSFIKKITLPQLMDVFIL